jgi:hypothetical protein
MVWILARGSRAGFGPQPYAPLGLVGMGVGLTVGGDPLLVGVEGNQ